MNKKKSSKDRLRESKFKLDALLEITLSINANLPTEALLAKYESILRNDLGIGKILIFKHSLVWECILNGGFPAELETRISVETDLLKFYEIEFVSEDSYYEGIDIIVPVYNNNSPLAFVLIGDIEEEGEGVSPVIRHLNFIQTISSIILVAIENIRLFKESLRQEAIRKEMELAARMQKMLIPDNKDMPGNEKLSMHGFYYPHYEVGGDYYDCIKLSDTRTGFCIADVSGKGISAAILMSNFQASLRALFSYQIDLGILLEKLNTLINANASGEKFITFFVARFDAETGILEYINAAHNPPVLYNTESGEIRYLQTMCVGIGMLEDFPEVKAEIVPIREYSKIVCYTDGLSELKDEDGTEISTREIIRFITNKEPVSKNIQEMFESLGIPDKNPGLFDDVSIIAADLLR